MPGLQGPILGLGGPFRLKRAHRRPKRGRSKVKWVKTTSFHFGEEALDQRPFRGYFTPVAEVQAAPLWVHSIY